MPFGSDSNITPLLTIPLTVVYLRPTMESIERLYEPAAETMGAAIWLVEWADAPFHPVTAMQHSLDPLSDELPRLLPHELHVWRVDLDRPPASLECLAECLSSDERRRAERFVREIDRRRFIVSHAAVRTILGQYLGIPPERVEMAIRPGGKPELTPPPDAPPLRFNLSHSDALAMIAVVFDREVGIDVERVRPMSDMQGIVERFFAPGERAVWQTLPHDERASAFFRCWTRKEAYLKARGVGLSSGLDKFEVAFAPGEPARLLRDNRGDFAADWHMYDLSPNSNYFAACAVERGAENLSVFDWPLCPTTPPEPEAAPFVGDPLPN